MTCKQKKYEKMTKKVPSASFICNVAYGKKSYGSYS